MPNKSTIIIGAGMAGMSCALELKKACVPYTLISPNIGGRVMYLPECEMNFGAVFFMKRYDHAKGLLNPGKLVLPSVLDLECHANLGKGYGVLSKEMTSAVPELTKFLKYLMGTFQPKYKAFKQDCEVMEFSAALAKNPLIKELSEMSASDLIERVGFPRGAEALVSQFVYACTGTKISLLNALDYLNCAQGIIDASTRFTFDSDAMKERLEEGGKVVMDKAASIQRSGALWQVSTEGGEVFEAANVVVAAPANIGRELLAPIVGDYEIRNASELHAYKVKGKIKKEYAGHSLHLFDQSIPLINIGARPDGAYEVFTCEPLDMGIFFEEYEVLYRMDWPFALFTNPTIVLDQCLGEGLYRAGDHNALGLEPAAISGIFVANKISGKA